MSIRAKILLGCLSLTLVTVMVGALTRSAQSELGAVAFRIYDEAFMSMSYLRSAQNALLGVGHDLAAGGSPDDLEARINGAVSDLDVARRRAMSPAGRKRRPHCRPA